MGSLLSVANYYLHAGSRRGFNKFPIQFKTELLTVEIVVVGISLSYHCIRVRYDIVKGKGKVILDTERWTRS